MRPHEKGGKRHEMPAYHKLEAFIDDISPRPGSGRWQDPPLPLRDRPDRRADGEPMNLIEAYRMVRRCTANAGFKCPATALMRQKGGSRKGGFLAHS